ncbi:von Willebrand factor C domain-containing protein 2-like [Latimeria chalumnae]|uniref:von Willebrand factor C domain-containing protein 2-like n=1 Tax=Latimeria chalumnae TaxID=7897 RepID=UPI0003C10445
MLQKMLSQLLPSCLPLYLIWGYLACFVSCISDEILLEADKDYEFSDYRGKWCVNENGFVYNLGDTFYPSRAACPCLCTEEGPLCVKPKCPKIHPRCLRVSYRSCCPKCEAVSNKCEFKGKSYRVLEEFMNSPCERCRCEINRQVYCSISECPSIHCVDPVFEPNQCCPVCKNGPNCFAGSTIIPAGVRVEIDKKTVCFCAHKDGTWETQHHATCVTREKANIHAGEQMVNKLPNRVEELP